MTTFALTNAYAYLGGHDFTADANQLTLSADGDVLDGTTFRPSSTGWRDLKMGLKKSALNMGGFWQSALSDAVDPVLWSALGTGGQPFTASARETEGMGAFLLKSLPATYKLLGKIGELAPFSLDGVCSDNVGIIRGQLFKAWGTVSATGALGSGLQLGAVSATQKAYATFHVFGTPGTTITVVLESATANTFAGATARATIGPLTTMGGTWMTPIVGPITDTWWRFRVSAITGTFTVAAAAGIQ